MKAFLMLTEGPSISEERVFQPRCADFLDRVYASFAKQAFMATLGAQIDEVRPGHVVLSLPFSDALKQQHGFHHAGATTSVLDSACGYAAYSLMDRDASVVTVEFKVNLLAPAKGAAFQFIGQVIRPGRTLSVCDGRAFAVDGGSRTLIATMSATMMAVPVSHGA